MLLPITLFLGVAHLAVITTCKPLKLWENLLVKHSWDEIPRGWEYEAPAPADYLFDLKFGMKQPRMGELITNLMEISNPKHPRYANHLNREQVERLRAPHPDSTRVIDEWLAYHSITPSNNSARRSKAGDWVTVRVTVEQAEHLLGTKYHVYKHSVSRNQVVRTLSYSLPEEVLCHIDVVAPTTYFGTLRSMKTTSSIESGISLNSAIDPASPSHCVTFVTPNCLRSLYNFGDYVPQQATNKLGVAGFLDQFANYADLLFFLDKFRPDAGGSNITTVLVQGGRNDQDKPGIEANLDIQYTYGLAYPTDIIYYSTGGSPPFNSDSFTPSNTNEPYLEFLDYLLDSHDIPSVLTISYGDDEQTVPQEYAISVCSRFAALGIRGTTVFSSSGDQGVGGGDCRTNGGKNQTLFQPVFPASCPYVTAVGGTTGNPELAAPFSGGGFSRYFLRPAYQNDDVGAFLTELGTTHQGLYNAGGRAYPDLSAQSTDFQVINAGLQRSVFGTSASSPTVAAIFSLLNDRRLTTRKSALGFINPLIYSNAKSGFNDITSGANPGCNTSGFTAVSGWDPVTGLGTPDFAKLGELT